MPTITIGDYLIKRLKEINIDTVFGVPGDYNMVRECVKQKVQTRY
jgi:TPP-dependent 2-oxoacid decarboxylase